MVSAVRSDRACRLGVKFRGYRLDGVDVPKCSFPLLLGDMGGIDHIHRLYLRRELFLASIVQPARFFIVLAVGAFFCVLGREVAVLFDHPTVTVGVVGGLVRGPVGLTGPVQDYVQLGGSFLVAFRGLFCGPDWGLRNLAFTVVYLASPPLW